jgi:Ran GTPase-activating protein (RanGAP) involved in mRNA processing and transport
MNSKMRDLLYNRVRRDDPSLTMLNLNHAGISNRGAKDLGAALHSNTHLAVLFLDNNGVYGSGCQALAAGMARHPALRFVFLSYNSVGNSGAEAIALALKENRNIQVLNLMHNSITAQGSVALAESLRCNSSLQKLNLDGNPIGDKGALALAAGLEDNHALTHLDLRYSCIKELPCVISSFCSVLRSSNKTLQELLFNEDDSSDDTGKHSTSNGIVDRDDLQFYLDLNRLGRDAFGTCNVSPAIWTRVLATASRNPRLLHAVLVARPDLVVASSHQRDDLLQVRRLVPSPSTTHMT